MPAIVARRAASRNVMCVKGMIGLMLVTVFTLSLLLKNTVHTTKVYLFYIDPIILSQDSMDPTTPFLSISVIFTLE